MSADSWVAYPENSFPSHCDLLETVLFESMKNIALLSMQPGFALDCVMQKISYLVLEDCVYPVKGNFVHYGYFAHFQGKRNRVEVLGLFVLLFFFLQQRHFVALFKQK